MSTVDQLTSRLPVVLAILDGWGIARPSKGNAISLADTPTFDMLWSQYPHTKLVSSGTSVGLLDGQVGNSEAGHLNIGAGRVVKQDILRIHEAIDNGSFFNNPAFEHAYQHVIKNKSRLHIMGLLTGEDSGHSHPKHLQALIEFFRLRGVKNIYLHLFTDGRDAPVDHGLTLVQRLRFHLQSGEQIVSLAGRMYLDRKKDWATTGEIYHSLILDHGAMFKDPEEYISNAYNSGVTDEFIPPATLAAANGKPVGLIRDNDAMVFFNLRSDRARQLTKPFVQHDFNKLNPKAFRRKRVLKNLVFVAMTDFGPDLGNILTAFPSPDIRNSLPVALQEFKQLYLAESEKFAHTTYFMNGGFTEPVAGEERMKVESPKLHNYAEQPDMAAQRITDEVCNRIKNQLSEVIVVNYANADMVAHTGNLVATIKACEEIDLCLTRLHHTIREHHGTLCITSDHGNAESLINPKTGAADTAHNGLQVPFILVNDGDLRGVTLKKEGKLADVAPTVLDVLGVTKPKEMTGRSLITTY